MENDLRKFISDYEKSRKYFNSKNIYAYLKEKQEVAINNAKKLKEYVVKIIHNSHPYTNAYEVIEFLLNL